MSKGERQRCEKVAGWMGAQVLGDRVDQLMVERADARQPLIADLIELRTQLRAANAKLEAVAACCAVPDGLVDGAIGTALLPPAPYVLVTTLQRVLDGAS